jgi:hypothetical protein
LFKFTQMNNHSIHYSYNRKNQYGVVCEFVTPNEELAYARSNTGKIVKRFILDIHENN